MIIPVVICITMVFGFPIWAQAFESERVVTGTLYEFDKKVTYDCKAAMSTSSIVESGTSFGTFSITGDLEQPQMNNPSSLIIYTGSASFNYSINSNYFNKSKTARYVCNDNKKNLDNLKLDSKVGKGTIVVQASWDGTNWVTQKTISNIGGDISNFNETLFQTTDMQITNGCYYRVLVAYKTKKKIGLFNNYRKYLEEYKFYIKKYEEPEEVDQEEIIASSGNRKELGIVEKKKKNKGYDQKQTIDVNDPHYGWSLGAFEISGFTMEATEGNYDNPVFLKITNEGADDTVKLTFKLKKDINRLNGNDKLTIVEDKKGYDQYFQVPKQNFGRGTLIIRKTDIDGTVHAPIIYTDYLSGVVSADANTVVEVNEEGDYEAALNYKIKKKNGLATATYDYRIFIKFSVRNGNCMFFPRDLSTELKATLSDGDIAPNGFELDLAESKDLELNIKKYDLSGQEDVLFNKPALDGNQYTEKGKYVITAKNKYTGEKVEKTIYVGDKTEIENYLNKSEKQGKNTEEEIEESNEEVSELLSDDEVNGEDTETIDKDLLEETTEKDDEEESLKESEKKTEEESPKEGKESSEIVIE